MELCFFSGEKLVMNSELLPIFTKETHFLLLCKIHAQEYEIYVHMHKYFTIFIKIQYGEFVSGTFIG